MKKTTILILAVLVLGGCYFTEELPDPVYDFPEIPDLGLQTVDDVMLWVAMYVTYQSDAIHDTSEYWQSPDQTYAWGTGDCEDFSILAMYLINRDVGTVPGMAVGTLDGGAHAWVVVEGEQWEPQAAWIVTGSPAYNLSRVISYREAIRRATTTHRSMLDG